jgi:hypothetical protein
VDRCPLTVVRLTSKNYTFIIHSKSARFIGERTTVNGQRYDHPNCGKLTVSLFLYPSQSTYFCLSLTNITDSMNIKYTQSFLDKLEAIPEESGYVLRYERGTFQSGYCILEQKKVVVLNKFLQIEGRVNTLIDLIPQLDINADFLPEEQRRLHAEIMANLATVENAESGEQEESKNEEEGEQGA